MKEIDAKGIYYRMLNRQIRESLSRGETEIILKNVLGQRYIGGGLNADARLFVYGTPGQDMAAFMNGPKIVVDGNAQDGIANTMNSGKIIVHGKAGEIPGHSMRGGKVFIKGDVEYRAGIHMKEYMNQIPWLVVGGTAKDYCGEYMAGGRIVVLNLNNNPGSPVGYSVGTGMHGGAIYVRGNVEKYQLGVGAIFADVEKSDIEFLKAVTEEFSMDIEMEVNSISFNDFIKITRKGHRPFGSLYTPAMNIKSQNPKHLNLTPPCTYNCPSNIPTPVFFNLIKDGNIKEAQLLMDEFTPFRMSVCGAVCPALCMDFCSRGDIDNSVEIQTLAQEYYPNFNPELPKEKRKEIISIIGAGPAGLSAAWQLSRRGYNVKVYDAADDLGGKVRKAIPRERLSDDTLDKDINRIRTLPIQFYLNSRIDRDEFEVIYSKSAMMIVATGAHIPKRIKYPGSERIISGLTFLEDINNGRPMDLDGKDVVIVGAGNVGMDIACESWRLGARRVIAIDIQEPLAFGKELEMAESLGTEILWPKMIEKLDEGRVYFTDKTELKADVLFFSIGEVPDTFFLPDSVMLDERGYVVTSKKSFKSSDAKIYVCGDIRKPGLITDAVGSGRLAAMEAHAAIHGESFIYPEMSLVPKRRINKGYFGQEIENIDKCLSCGTCIFCDKCIEVCPQDALSRNGEIFTVDSVICTGCYTCVHVCPRGAIQYEDVEEFAVDDVDIGY
ncbi:MAG: FAD-dependent oxidoreductase [Spirochaetota bacterium]|nr:FAD-dependent oxidoreductase [Spirochaetota bacterium]